MNVAPDVPKSDTSRIAAPRRRASACHLAVAEDDDAIGHFFHFFDEVGDVDDGMAAPLQFGDEREQPPRVGLRQAARGLVEHEHTAPDGERAADLDELLGGGGEGGHRRVD